MWRSPKTFVEEKVVGAGHNLFQGEASDEGGKEKGALHNVTLSQPLTTLRSRLLSSSSLHVGCPRNCHLLPSPPPHTAFIEPVPLPCTPNRLVQLACLVLFRRLFRMSSFWHPVAIVTFVPQVSPAVCVTAAAIGVAHHTHVRRGALVMAASDKSTK